MSVTNLNKSNNKEEHKCDFCGKSPEELWEGVGIDGQYCFEHFRLAHPDVEEFDKWRKEFLNENSSNS